MPPVTPPEQAADVPPASTTPSPRPVTEGLVVMGAQRWPWYDDRTARPRRT